MTPLSARPIQTAAPQRSRYAARADGPQIAAVADVPLKQPAIDAIVRHHEVVIVRPGWQHALSDQEIVVAQQALAAAVDGPFFEDWEFDTLFGLERDEVRAVLNGWPDELDPQRQFEAVNGALNNLTGYPHGASEAAWSAFLPASREDLDLLLRKIHTVALD